MREILFKAKHKKDGNWVFGYVWDNGCGNVFIRRTVNLSGNIVVEDIEVDPETVCQWTGLTDKNRVKIFENDIVNDEDVSTEEWKAKIVYGEFNCGCCSDVFGYTVEPIGNGFMSYIREDPYGCSRKISVKVIGNIHDEEE